MSIQRDPKMGAWTSDNIDKRPFRFEFTMDAEKISRARYVVFADNSEEAVLKVRKIIDEPTNGAISSVSFLTPYHSKETNTSDITVGEATIQGDCTEIEVIDYVKKNGNLKLPYQYRRFSEGTAFCLKDRETQEKFWKAGIHMDMHNGFWLSHDPKRASRQRGSHRAATTKAAKKASILRAHDIYPVIEAFDVEGHHVNDEKYSHRFRNKGWKTREHFCKLLLTSIDYFNFHYGKNAHRKIIQFQEIVNKWTKTPEKKRKTFGKMFALWMEEEMKARKCKPVNKKDMQRKNNTITARLSEGKST